MQVAALEEDYTLQSSLIVCAFPLERISSFYLYDNEIFFAVKKNFIYFYFLTDNNWSIVVSGTSNRLAFVVRFVKDVFFVIGF